MLSICVAVPGQNETLTNTLLLLFFFFSFLYDTYTTVSLNLNLSATTQPPERPSESERERMREIKRDQDQEQNGDLLRINDALATLDCSTLERVGARATRARERAYKCVCSSVAEQWSHSSVLALSRSCSAVCGSRSRCAYRSRNRAGCVTWSSLGVYVSGGESVGCLE